MSIWIQRRLINDKSGNNLYCRYLASHAIRFYNNATTHIQLTSESENVMQLERWLCVQCTNSVAHPNICRSIIRYAMVFFHTIKFRYFEIMAVLVRHVQRSLCKHNDAIFDCSPIQSNPIQYAMQCNAMQYKCKFYNRPDVVSYLLAFSWNKILR